MEKNHELLVGAHVSITGGLHKAIERGESIGATAIQIFTQSSRSWFNKKITQEESDQFKQAQKASTIQCVVTHASYLINIGSPVHHTAQQSAKALLDELIRSDQLGIPYVVLHPGAHTGAGFDACIEQVAKSLDHVLERFDGKTMILLETMAGKGTTVGRTFEQIKSIIDACHHKCHLGVCFDTCHVFWSGYDIGTAKGYLDTIDLFDQIIGLDHLKAFHLNDSKTICNSHVDRHEALGKGKIPLEIFGLIVNDKRFIDVPKILETPSDDEMRLYAQEIALLKEMLG